MRLPRWHRPGSSGGCSRQFTVPCALSRARLSTFQPRPLGTLENASVASFREQYFIPELPTILPRSLFRDLPAFKRWFQSPPSSPSIARLNLAYLEQHGSDVPIPLELTQSASARVSDGIESTNSKGYNFQQLHAPLSLFLEWMRVAEAEPQSLNLYLAQCQLIDLPQILRKDFPTPDLVLEAGQGDVYDTNLWIGCPPTYTPLHRDPNPNLFVQLAGQKIVRLLAPCKGQAIFTSVRRQLGLGESRAAAAIRGEEMMQGQERTRLEEAVWNIAPGRAGSTRYEGYEAVLQAGDGLFIPKGWWHSIKGVGSGVTASVNWWFR